MTERVPLDPLSDVRQAIRPERPRKESPARRGGPGRCWHTDRDLDRILEIQPMHNRTNPPGAGTVQPAGSSPPARVRLPQTGASSLRQSPWVRHEPDPEQVLAELRVRNPALVAWWGDWTGSYWHLDQAPDGTFRLLEAATAEELHAQLLVLARRAGWRPGWTSVPQPSAAAYQHDPTGSARRVPTPKTRRVPVAPEVRRGMLHRFLRTFTGRRPERPAKAGSCRKACCVPRQRGRQDGWDAPC